MKVLKFGGTSLKNAGKIKAAATIATKNERCIVVCSAMAGVTDQLVEVSQEWHNGNTIQAKEKLQTLEKSLLLHCYVLFGKQNNPVDLFEYIECSFNKIIKQLECFYSTNIENQLLAIGEQVTAHIFNYYLKSKNVKTSLISATDIIRLNSEGMPVVEDISERIYNIDVINHALSTESVIITQGYICSDSSGKISNLGRGGSDYTATLIGAAVNADSIEIWTDVDGLHNNDPRFVEYTKPVRELSYAEAAELAYFGAKILHPSCVRPAREKNIPILLKNTLNPSSIGTIIHSKFSANGIKAIAAKDDISIIRIASGRMLNTHGFLKKVFEIFDYFKISVDVITTSEVSVSITFEDKSNILELIKQMNNLGKVSVEPSRSIICIVGDMMHPGYVAEILQKVKQFDIRMISLGASSNNITIVIPQKQKAEALTALHDIFNTSESLHEKEQYKIYS